jgi:hypothetical protein
MTAKNKGDGENVTAEATARLIGSHLTHSLQGQQRMRHPAIAMPGFNDSGVRKFIRVLIVAGNATQNFKGLPTKS